MPSQSLRRVPGFLNSRGVASGLTYTVVAQGQSDAFSFPVSTGTFDQSKHVCRFFPSTGGATGYSAAGGNYTWNGSQIDVQVWTNATNPFASGVWQILEILNLSAPIQHISDSIAPGTVDGWINFDKTITALTDYTKAEVIGCGFGFSGSVATEYISQVQQFLASNTNLRRRIRVNYASGSLANITLSSQIIPLI